MAAYPQTESRTETVSYTEFLTDPSLAKAAASIGGRITSTLPASIRVDSG